MNRYVKSFDDSKTVSLLDEDGKLLKKYNEIWSKIKEIMERKKFGSDTNFPRNKIRRPKQNLTITKSPQNTITKQSQNHQMVKQPKKESSAFVCQQ